MVRRFLLPLVLVLIAGCAHNQRPQPAAPAVDAKTAQADCTRLVADTARLRRIVSEPAGRDSLNALCRKGNVNIRVF